MVIILIFLLFDCSMQMIGHLKQRVSVASKVCLVYVTVT